jgi:hypothetical protein
MATDSALPRSFLIISNIGKKQNIKELLVGISLGKPD